MKKIKVTIITLIILLASTTYGATHYVSSTGSDKWANSTNISTPCSLYTANQNADDDDVVTLLAGTYYIGTSSATGNGADTSHLAPGIIPVNSGSAGHPITYTVNGSNVVTFVGRADVGTSSMGIWINGKSHIVVNGKSLGQLKLEKMGMHLVIGPYPTTSDPSADSAYNEVAYVHFYRSFESGSWGGSHWQGSGLWKQAYYNRVHHCKFERHGYLGKTEGSNEGNLFDLGGEYANESNERTRYNVIENNEFLHAGHATFGMFGDYNVIRNNYFHNEGWYEIEGDLYGYRNIISDGVPGYVGHNIFEGNRIGYAGPNYTYDVKSGNFGGTGMKVCSPYNIIRHNAYFNNSATALSFNTYSSPLTATGSYNRVYNNTFFYNGRHLKLPGEDYTYFYPVVFTPGNDYSVTYNNVLVNNLFYDNSNTRSSTLDVWDVTGGETLAGLTSTGKCTIEHNYNAGANENTDPLFINESLGNKSSWTLPNLNISADSPAKDEGTFLTQSNGAGSSSKNLIVDDARYFQDANFGQGSLSWPSNINIQADWIAIGTVSNVVQISSINYSTNTITLVSPMTWKDEAPVWLYKKSDGKVVLYENGPDMGAHEYNEFMMSSPQNVRIITSN